MARVSITRQWADGDVLVITIKADHSYPDSIDEARAAAVRAFGEAHAVMVTTDEDVES